MKREDIIKYLRDVDLIDFRDDDEDDHVAELVVHVERLVAKATTAEREACAKVCEAGVNNANDWDSSYWDQACENRAAAIRARGQA